MYISQQPQQGMCQWMSVRGLRDRFYNGALNTSIVFALFIEPYQYTSNQGQTLHLTNERLK